MSRNDAWTGGQYSLVRALVCGTVAWILLGAIFAGHAGFLAWLCVPLSLAVAAGAGGRIATALLAAGLLLGACSIPRDTLWLAAVWLGAHLIIPLSPYGAVAARGREDPAGDWLMPRWYAAASQALFVVTRVGAGLHTLAAGHVLIGVTLLVLAGMALARHSALLAWGVSFGLSAWLSHAGYGSASGVWLLHVLTFQPAWIKPREYREEATVFYDGSCALCHGFIRFLLSEDVAPARFRLAPFDSEAFTSRVPDDVRATLPDSVVVVRGRALLVKSAAVTAVLDALGGWWWMLATIGRVVPTTIGDAAYDAVASRRYHWFGRKTDSCPMMPPQLRARIDT